MKETRASIDIGSNSVLLLILNTSTKEIVEEHSTITGLGKSLDQSGVFLDQSMDDTFDALRKYLTICQQYKIGAKDIIMTGTEASRVAKNAPGFYKKVFDELELKIDLISGAGEAFYTAYGIAQMLPSSNDKMVLIDVGGASTEIILLETKPFKVLSSVSIPVGSVRTTDWLITGVEKEKFQQAYLGIDFSRYSNMNVICVAGTLTSLALMLEGLRSFDPKSINKYMCDLDTFSKYTEQLKSHTKEELALEFRFLGKRVHSIVGGAFCATRVLEKIKAKQLNFSTYGLRYGTVLKGKIDGNYIL